MGRGILYLVSVIAMFSLLPAEASGYAFEGNAAGTDTVRLVLNQPASHDDIMALDVVASGIPVFWAAAFDVDFDPSVMEWAAGDVNSPDGFSKGDLLKDAWYMIALERHANGSANHGTLVAGITGDDLNPASGSGTIVTLYFRIIRTGQTSIDFVSSNLIRPDGSFTPTAWHGGTLDVDRLPSPGPREDGPPVVTLQIPSDGAVLNSSDAHVMCSASDDEALASISLYTDVSGSWSLCGSVQTGLPSWTGSFYLEGVPEGTYKWNCKAEDSQGQLSWGDSDFYFTVDLPPGDTEPPVRLNSQVSGNDATGNISISLETDEDATCRYSQSPGLVYGEMKSNFSQTGSTTHLTNVSIPVNLTYSYNVRCRDSHGNTNEDDFIITFTVGDAPADNTPPEVLGFSPRDGLESGSEYGLIRVYTEEPAECRISGQPGMEFGSMDVFGVTNSINHTHTVVGLSEGMSEMFYVRCRDYSGNTNSETGIEMYVCNEADSDCNREIHMTELTAYIGRWYVSSRDVPMNRLMDAVVLWKGGGSLE